jgi:adenylylsulfate kinase
VSAPPCRAGSDGQRRDRAGSWRVLGTLTAAALVLVLAGRSGATLALGALDAAAKTALRRLPPRTRGRLRPERRPLRPGVLWFTGLSGSGKSTIAGRIAAALSARGLPVEHLDGDGIRQLLGHQGFTRPEREAHIRSVGYLASRLEAHGVFVVASLVSPYSASRDFVRGLCRNFVEVYVSTPLEECERRDAKGLYARARRGEISNFTGVDDPYEPPTRPEVTIDTRAVSPDRASAMVLDALQAGR